MVMVYRNGQMELNTKACGRTTKLMVRVFSTTQMVTSLMESGKLIKQMDLGSTDMPMEPGTKVIGKKTSNMVMEKKNG